ncbi:uncharacterized protein LOC131624640 [Vicia villosa]|uniref:uncharacterized protein LOC131624640 n=1 Tax=Vicia villosa TaxID=3911 RepID=UPI00273AF987|nr:uncharacterized protein LOC131624640 [Vicia villosa]
MAEKYEANIDKSFNSRRSLALKNDLYKVRSGEDEGGWIDEDDLKKLKAQWEDEKWQNIYMINKQNRKCKAALNVHNGGSISTREHAKKMRVELHREPTCFEFYQRLHRPKGKPNEWFNETEDKIAEMYQTQIFEKNSQSGGGSNEQSTQQSDNDVYMNVVGAINKKGRIFGLGSLAANVK